MENASIISSNNEKFRKLQMGMGGGYF